MLYYNCPNTLNLNGVFQRPVINLCNQETVGYLEKIDAMVEKLSTTVTVVTLWLDQNLVLATMATGLGKFQSVKVIIVLYLILNS